MITSKSTDLLVRGFNFISVFFANPIGILNSLNRRVFFGVYLFCFVVGNTDKGRTTRYLGGGERGKVGGGDGEDVVVVRHT